MSAFICGPDLFRVLGVFAASRGTCGEQNKVDARYVKGCDQLHGYRPGQLVNVRNAAVLRMSV